MFDIMRDDIIDGLPEFENFQANMNWLFFGSLELIIKSFAARYRQVKNIFCIASGSLYPVALESALKIKEASYKHAEGIYASEFKHGPLALIFDRDPYTLSVAFLESEFDLGTINTIREIRSRGGKVLVVSGEKFKDCDAHIPIAGASYLQPIYAAITMQLFAYYLAVFNNINPDKPRNLAKSVTVR